MENECKNDRNPNWPASVKLKSLLISFRNTISRKEIESFRGAVVNAMENANVLFHNHEADGRLRYAYPLIQYKRIHQKAAILCLGEGTEAIGEFFAACQFNVKMGERETTLEIESVKADQSLVQIWDSLFTYQIRRWLPLNQDNYETYSCLSGLVEQCAFLEKVLTGNLLSFASGIGLHFEQQVKCHITELSDSYAVWYKDTKLMAFDAEFRCNVSLPEFVGLGKGVSLGMGTVVRRGDVEEIKLSEKNRVFLLGGHDLEMMTIKDMLMNQRDCEVLDKNLQWDNAVLSAYKDEIDKYGEAEIYCVELQEDIALSENQKSRYHRIDHHNDLSFLPSALEQTAAVLGVSLNRRQQLIAANDKGYIPAMKALQASEDEIREIRLQDRATQGVTEEDELLAEKSIADSFEKYDNIYIVKSLTSRFSTICDRLYPYKRLFIYTDDEWMFYGEGKATIVAELAEEIYQGRVFHGGGDNGYIGCVKDSFSKNEIEQFVKQVINKYGHN